MPPRRRGIVTLRGRIVASAASHRFCTPLAQSSSTCACPSSLDMSRSCLPAYIRSSSTSGLPIFTNLYHPRTARRRPVPLSTPNAGTLPTNTANRLRRARSAHPVCPCLDPINTHGPRPALCVRSRRPVSREPPNPCPAPPPAVAASAQYIVSSPYTGIAHQRSHVVRQIP